MTSEKNSEWDYRSEINKQIVPGTILLSEPFMLDPSFARTACLVVNHQKTEGTFGLVLNRKSNLKLSELVEVDYDWNIYSGGPVGTDNLFFVHNNNCDLKDTIKISENLYWNGDFEELFQKIKDGMVKESDIKFFVGYSGWDSGQLRREIIENSWIVSNNTTQHVLKQSKYLWNDILKEMGGNYKEFANYPINPSLN